VAEPQNGSGFSPVVISRVAHGDRRLGEDKLEVIRVMYIPLRSQSPITIDALVFAFTLQLHGSVSLREHRGNDEIAVLRD